MSVSHGVPAALLFVAFLVVLTLRLGGAVDVTSVRLWAQASLVAALTQLAVYSLLPASMPLIGVIAGLGLREAASGRHHPPDQQP